MNYTIENANEYILKNKNKVDKKYRQKFHMMPPIGWMNDPNGLVKFKDEYHLFYQFHPYDAKWGPMHWGHFVSKDLIKYEDVDVALAPEHQDIESGCFSGGAIANDNEIHLVYTSHYEKNGIKKEVQKIASSKDSINFNKNLSCIFNNEFLPDGVSKNDFRDPNPVYINGYYYLFVGGKLEKENMGVIIVLKGHTLDDLKYDFFIGPCKEFGYMCECPSYFKLNDMDCLLISGCGVKRDENNYLNINSSLIIAGNIDFENKKMDITYKSELDKGDAFYAPQIISGEKENTMIGWLEMWEKKYPTYELLHNWTGCFTIPRKIFLQDGIVCQMPIDNIKKYYSKTYCYEGNEVSRTSDLLIEAKGIFSIEFIAENGKFIIGQTNNGVFLDARDSNNMNNTYRRTNLYYENVSLRVLLDISSVELFVNNGKEAISTRVYLDSDYKLLIDGQVEKIIVNEIEVDGNE